MENHLINKCLAKRKQKNSQMKLYKNGKDLILTFADHLQPPYLMIQIRLLTSRGQERPDSQFCVLERQMS